MEDADADAEMKNAEEEQADTRPTKTITNEMTIHVSDINQDMAGQNGVYLLATNSLLYFVVVGCCSHHACRF